PGAHKWKLDLDAVLALKPQPDTRVESAQATAIAALEKAETATAETASVRAELEKALAEERAELEKALAEERAKVKELQAALQAVTERMKKTETAEGQVEAATNNPQGRKPGKKPDYPLWRLDAAVFARQFFKKKKRMPSAGEVAEHLQLKCDGWEPHPT